MASSRGRFDDLEVEDEDDTPAFDFKGQSGTFLSLGRFQDTDQFNVYEKVSKFQDEKRY